MIELARAKNGSYTCTYAGRSLHSLYNPEAEAEKFCNTITCDFTPFCVIILGACLSYCATGFRKRFPDVPLYTVQYDNFFLKPGTYPLQALQAEDGVFCTEGKTAEELSEELFISLGEQRVFGALFTEWPAAAQTFSKESEKAWTALKILLQKSRDVLATRAFFSLCWLKNSVRFFIRANRICKIEAGTKSILVAASGPSLKKILPLIKIYRNSFFLLALSSSLAPLTANGIIPDLCISTDGGFYAEYHLRILQRLCKQGIRIPLAVSAESRLPSYLLENLPLIPLRYGDGLESRLLDFCRIPAVKALRNGSVSGTAAFFALSLTNAPVYFCGLDLENGNGYSHTLPNELETNDSLKDNRLKPLSLRVYKTDSAALALYRRWFSSLHTDFTQRIFRVAADPYKNPLSPIKDITPDEFIRHISEHRQGKKPLITETDGKTEYMKTKAQKSVYEFLHSERHKFINHPDSSACAFWYENCAPLEYLSVLKYPESQEFKTKLEQKLLHTFEELFKLCK